MSNFLVTWGIDVEAETPEDAAKQALLIQRDYKSIATVFDVSKQCKCGGYHEKDVRRIDISPRAISSHQNLEIH